MAKNRKNFIILMVFVEIMFLGIILIFIYTAHFFSLPEGQVYALINLGISAAEAAIGFGLFIASFRHFSFAVFEGFNKLKG